MLGLKRPRDETGVLRFVETAVSGEAHSERLESGARARRKRSDQTRVSAAAQKNPHGYIGDQLAPYCRFQQSLELFNERLRLITGGVVALIGQRRAPIPPCIDASAVQIELQGVTRSKLADAFENAVLAGNEAEREIPIQCLRVYHPRHTGIREQSLQLRRKA